MPSGAWHFGNEVRGITERLKAELGTLTARVPSALKVWRGGQDVLAANPTLPSMTGFLMSRILGFPGSHEVR